MEVVTEEQLKQAVKEHHIRQFASRTCSICDTQLHYLISDDYVFYDARCECASLEDIRVSSWSSLLSVFNILTPKIRENLWQRFINNTPIIPEKL